MKATIENNRAALGLMALLVVIILSFVWWQFLYKPATADNNSAMLANQTAQAALSDAQSRLTKAQQEVDSAKRENGGKFDDAIAKVQVAREAVPDKARIDDALIVLEKYAKRSGIRTSWNLTAESDDVVTSTAPAGTGDAKPLTIKLTAAGKWSELKSFIGYVESSASAERGNLHVRGRIFNVVQVRVSTPEDVQRTDPSSTDFSAAAAATTQTELVLGKNEYKYELAIEMYTSDFGAAAASASTGAAAGTGAAGSSTTPGAGTGTTPDATTTPGASAGSGSGVSAGTGSTPGAGSSTGSTTPTGAAGSGAGTSTTPGSTPGGATSPTGTSSTPGATTPSGTAGMPSTTGATG